MRTASSTTASMVSTSTAAAAPSTSSSNQKFEARRSNKAASAAVKADGATWRERLAVCEGVTDDGQPSLKIRSYYRNHATRERVWDEPPSGASEIIFSTAEMRKIAEQHMKELQLTLDLIPPDVNLDNNDNDAKKSKQGNKKNNGIFGRFKRKDKEKPTLKDDSKDLNLQRAIARSMVEQHGGMGFGMGFGNDEPIVYYDPEAGLDALADASGASSLSATLMQIQQQEQDDIALAQALSMSTREAAAAIPQQQNENISEDEMMQKAIEASRLEALASFPGSIKNDNGGISDNLSPFDPYSPHADGSSPTSSTKKTPPPSPPAPASESSPPQKLEADQGLKNKPASRVFGGRKKMEVKAGVV
jgi:hypothetical protein